MAFSAAPSAETARRPSGLASSLANGTPNAVGVALQTASFTWLVPPLLQSDALIQAQAYRSKHSARWSAAVGDVSIYAI